MKPTDKAPGGGARKHAPGEPPSRACPICRKPTANAYRPFCSKRCADIDLGRWLGEGYAIPAEPAGADDTGGGEQEDERA